MDEKLERALDEILSNYGSNNLYFKSSAIKDIEQAFRDAGWVEPKINNQ